MLSKVLAGVDGTPSGRDAAVLACALGAADDADVVLVGAYTDPLLPFPPVLSRTTHLGKETEQMLQEVRREVAPKARCHAVPDLSAGRALCHAVDAERADLLVLGSSHRVPEGSAGAGRTGRQALHGAACAVALAARGLHGSGVSLRRIVVGVDGSEEAGAALTLARELAQRSGARLTAVGVVDDRLPAAVAPAGVAFELVEWDEIVAENRATTERLIADVTASGGVDGETRVGDPAEELANAAEGADLLVLGSRRWGPLARLVIGSTGEELLRQAPCSLLLVPRPEGTADSES